MKRVTKICPLCSAVSFVEATDEEINGLMEFVKGEKQLQEALPNTSAPVREFLYTGFCYKCQLDTSGNTDERIIRKE